MVVIWGILLVVKCKYVVIEEALTLCVSLCVAAFCIVTFTCLI